MDENAFGSLQGLFNEPKYLIGNYISTVSLVYNDLVVDI